MTLPQKDKARQLDSQPKSLFSPSLFLSSTLLCSLKLLSCLLSPGAKVYQSTSSFTGSFRGVGVGGAPVKGACECTCVSLTFLRDPEVLVSVSKV